MPLSYPFYATCTRKQWQGGHVICCRMLPTVLPELQHDELEINVHFENAYANKKWHSATGTNRHRALHQGQISLTCREQPHSVEWLQEAETLLLFLTPDAFALSTHETMRGSTETIEAYSVEDAFLYQLAQKLHFDLSGNSPYGVTYSDALFVTLTVHILQNYAVHSQPRLKISGQLSAQTMRLVQDYVAAHLGNDLSLAEMSRIAGYSPYHFCRLFRKSMGQSPHQYLIQRRIEEGRRLLLTTELTVGEISHAVGFNSQSHFTRHFHRLIGVTPQKFRQK